MPGAPSDRPEWVRALFRKHATPLPNLAVRTLGGKQIWGDVFLYDGYRIQRNAVTGHCRLLGPRDVRLAWGSYTDCHRVFCRLRTDRSLRTRSRHLVLLLHGIFRSKDAMGPMQRGLARAGFETQAVNYPSTRRSLQSHADQVHTLLDRYEDVDRVSLVGHSMGGLVARFVFASPGAWQQRIQRDRLVLIATPNNGAEVVRALDGAWPFHTVAGPAGVQMNPARARHLPAPDVPFGLVAGVRGDGRGYNPLLDGEDDFTVSLDEALLDGAEDTLLVKAVHTFIMQKPNVIEATARYLSTGRFGV